MGFDIGAGLSALGGAVSQTAGTAALELQKSALEKDRDALANEMATERETKLEQMRQTGSLALAERQSKLAVSAAKQEDIDKADLALAQAPKLAALAMQTAKAQASDPEYIKSLKILTSAQETSATKAAAAAS